MTTRNDLQTQVADLTRQLAEAQAEANGLRGAANQLDETLGKLEADLARLKAQQQPKPRPAGVAECVARWRKEHPSRRDEVFATLNYQTETHDIAGACLEHLATAPHQAPIAAEGGDVGVPECVGEWKSESPSVRRDVYQAIHEALDKIEYPSHDVVGCLEWLAAVQAELRGGEVG